MTALSDLLKDHEKTLAGRQSSPTYAKVRHPKAAPQHRDQSSTRNNNRTGQVRRSLSVHKNAEYHLSRAQLQALIASATNTRDRALIGLFVDTGIRRFEAADLEGRDIDLDDAWLVARKGKGGRLRLLPLSDRLCDLLRPLVTRPPSGPLFHGRDGLALSTRQINRIVAGVGNCAGIVNPNPRYKNVTCHLLRHSFARHWKDAGGDIETLSRILGHASVKTTWDTYGTQSIEDIKRHYDVVIGAISHQQSQAPDRGS